MKAVNSKVSASKASLVPMQRWMQHAIVHAHEGRPARGRAESWILPSRTLAPDERVEIYAGMYRLRMIEALETDYPALQAAVGHHTFHELVMEYARAFPSKHYSLNFFGDRMPEFLARARSAPRLKKLGLKNLAFLADVARIEQAMTVVFDLPESPRLDASALAQLPPEAWATARIELIRPFQLHALAHDANKEVTALRHGKAISSTKKKPSWAAIYRKDWVVWRMDLEPAAFEILSALHKGKTLPRAITAGARVFDGKPETLQAKIQGWFAEWGAEGFFSALVLKD
jgi:hypothetical protein